jgi:phospholipid/cholesterol/gamma-HCH transport system substrate-binding protein
MIKIHLSSEAKIGLISILVLAITIWGFNFLKGKNIIKPTDEYYVVFDRIDGLIEAGNVMMQGYKVGNITTIKFDHEHSGKFILRFVLEDRVKLANDSYVKVKQINPLAATSDLEIVPGKSKMYYASGDTIKSVVNKGLADILISLQSKVDNILIGIDSTLHSFNEILTPESRAHLKSGIDNLNSSLEALNSSLNDGGNLHKSFDNIQSVTGNLRSNNEEISAILTHLSKASAALDSADLKSTLDKLDKTLASTRDIMLKINSGEGTMGKLVNDSSLYVILDSTASNLNVLIKDLKEHPKRYVHVSVFGGKKNN